MRAFTQVMLVHSDLIPLFSALLLCRQWGVPLQGRTKTPARAFTPWSPQTCSACSGVQNTGARTSLCAPASLRYTVARYVVCVCVHVCVRQCPCWCSVQVFDLLNSQKRLKVWEDGKQQVQVRWGWGWGREVCPLWLCGLCVCACGVMQ